MITMIKKSHATNTGVPPGILPQAHTQVTPEKNEERYKTFLDSIEDGCYELDLAGSLTFFNPRLTEIFGYTTEEMMGKNYKEYTEAETSRDLFKTYNEVFITGLPSKGLEWVLINKDGSRVFIEASITLIRDPYGNPTGFRGIARDISKRKQMEEELRESREYLNAIINCMGDPVFVNDQQHRYVLVNSAFAELIGSPCDEIIGKTDHDFFPKEQIDVFWRFDDEVFETGKETTKEEFINNALGQVLTVLTKKTLFTDKSGNKYIVGVIHDITARKRTEEELRQSEKRFRLVVQSANDAFITFDSNGAILFWNVKAEMIFGYKAEEVLGRGITVIISKRFRDEFTNVMRMSIHAMKRVSTSEFTPIGKTAQMMGLRKDGHEFPIEISTSIWESEGRHLCTSIIRDITQRKQMEDSLRREAEELRKARMELEEAYIELKNTQTHVLQQEKMASIGLLAAGVAHEINNPMGFISSNLGTLKKYLDKGSEYMAVLERLVEQVEDQAAQAELKEKRKALKIDFIAEDIKDLITESLEGADRVKKIVQDLKSFSRVDQSEYKQANINECMETTINIVWNELKYKATVNKEYGEIPLTKCYPQQLNQVFMNLLVNAAQAIEKQGVITVRTWREDGSILASITDTGCGMEPQIVNRIFEPFFTTKEVGKGTGLGLSITYDIVKKHDGEITVQSALGKGTTFTVRIPLVEET
jgi:two-component system NtrC family sensor kinase